MKNKKEVNVNLFLLSSAYIITIIFIFFGSYIQYGYQITVGDVSPRDFRATHQIENRVATERLREEARNNVPPIFIRNNEIGEIALINLSLFFEEIKYYRELNREEPIQLHIPADEIEYFEENIIPEFVQEQEPRELRLPEIEFLSSSQIEVLMDFDNFELFEEQTINALTSIFQEDIQDSALPSAASIANYVTSQIFLAQAILGNFIEPNMILNEELTEQIRYDLANEVTPILFLQGQLIVSSGEIITDEIYTALVDFNYISDGYTVNLVPLVGAALILLIIFGMGTAYIYLFSPFLNKNRKHRVLLFTLYIILISPTVFLADAPFVFVPVLLFTMLVGMLLRYKLAIVLNVAATLISLLITDAGLNFIIYFLITGTITAVITRYALERSKVIVFSGLVSVISAGVAFSVLLLVERTITADTFLITGFAALTGFFVVVICMGTLPLWENFFGVTTPIKLLEYTNPSNELLRRLSLEASGTYHHSIIVANLAEAAAYEIGADAVLVRVGAYFHDIGKLRAPSYFTENQMGYNYHDNIDPASSAYIIKDHVSHGLELAEKHKLPNVIKDIIAEHHGTTLIKYFYFKAKNIDENIKENSFRYNGPNPTSRESAIIMLADTVEAAVRSCITNNTKTKDEIPEFIEQLVNDKLTEGQLLNSDLTLKDIQNIKKVFLHVLNGMYHERVAYPTKGDENNEADNTK